jgi:hypothetical protein
MISDKSRIIRADKRGAIASDLAPILLRLGVNLDAWPDTISRFESKFCLVSGSLPNLRNFAQQMGSKWLKGVTGARNAFAVSPPDFA